MRPRSIVLFERLFLASLVISVLNFMIGYEAMSEDLAGEQALARLGIGSGVLIGTFVVSLAIYLLLWFFIARKASTVAKWILVAFLGLSLISFASMLAGPWDLILLLSVAVYALQMAAAVCLFQDDAKAWLSGEWSADTATFD